MADINQITRGDLQKMEDCKLFLVKFLESYRYRTPQKKVRFVGDMVSPGFSFGVGVLDYVCVRTKPSD